MAKTVYIKSKEEIELIRESSLLVGKTLAEVARNIKPGITTAALDKLAEEFIRSHGAEPAFKGYNGFPATLCISPNQTVVHGIPGAYVLKEGDIVSVDCGVKKNGFFGDSAYTFAVGEIPAEVRQLLSVTKKALYLAVEQCVEGKRIGDISHAVQQYCESFGYGIVRELVGHGVGRELHEAPEVPNYGKKGSGMKLAEGMVLAVEPMVNLGAKNVKQEGDGWTVNTADGKPSAHFEHTIAIGKGKADVLSSFSEIERILEEQHILI
ncbi:MAG: type I methionyl aminopeptidase [Bacteroidota bacterium]